MTRKVIIDCDPGIDAAIALSVALFDPELEVVAVTAVEGTVNAEQVTTNVQSVIEQLDAPRLPRVGSARPCSTSVTVDGRELHGEDGLANAGFDTSKLHHQHASDKVICDAIRAYPDDITVICLGPLTNIAAAFQRDPEVETLVDRLVIAGGTVDAPGDVTAAAEFNIYYDVDSARSTFQSHVTKTLVPLDVTHRVPFTLDLLDQLPRETTSVGRFLRRIAPYYFRAHHQRLGLEHVFLNGVVALTMATYPALFETQEWPVDVETRGELTLGETVFDRRSHTNAMPNVEVAVATDPDQVRAKLLQGLQRAAS